MSDEQWLIPGSVMVRPEPSGKFDELLLYDDDGECRVHAEMMDDDCLWIGIYPDNKPGRRVCMWIRVKGRKLHVNAAED